MMFVRRAIYNLKNKTLPKQWKYDISNSLVLVHSNSFSFRAASRGKSKSHSGYLQFSSSAYLQFKHRTNNGMNEPDSKAIREFNQIISHIGSMVYKSIQK